MKDRLIYLDNAATTRLDERVLEAMLPFMRDSYANPSSKYVFASSASSAIRKAREKVAALINAEPDEIIFTCSGTVADNIAIRGAINTDKGEFGLLTDEIEHPAVLQTVRQYENTPGVRCSFVRCDREGYVEADDFAGRLTGQQGLASIMYVNNELGTIQDIGALADMAHAKGYIFHTDAVAAAAHLRIDVKKLPVDMLSVSGHKIYGPKGSGFLYVRRGTGLRPIFGGGGQERGFMPGTQNVPAIVGLGEACALLGDSLENYEKNATECADAFLNELMLQKCDMIVNRSDSRAHTGSTISVSFKGIDSESLLVELDMKGVCCSAGSACHSGVTGVSHVLSAINMADDYIRGTLRFTFSKDNSREEAVEAAQIVGTAVHKITSLS